ncbi:MAG: hypothetical protein KA756_14305, partial [Steroidobacteraceae bacterium]|nr:hypothetical protein [Steroidobacteraceae bacterium]
GVANEVDRVVRLLNERYAADEFNRVWFSEVQRIAGTCITGCAIVDPRPLAAGQGGREFRSRLVAVASGSA